MILFTGSAFLTLLLVPCLEVPESGNPEELLVPQTNLQDDETELKPLMTEESSNHSGKTEAKNQ